MTNIQPDEHSDIVGGSTAARRINCPRSAALEKLVPKDKGSIYAREGTALHALIAVVIAEEHEPLDLLPYTHVEPARGEEPEWTFVVDETLWEELGEPSLVAFDRFVGQLEDDFGEAAKIKVETRCAMPGIAGAFGTTDILIRCGDTAVVWDWKFGRLGVSAEENEQLMFYARAAQGDHPEWFEGVERVVLAIMQPKVNSMAPDVWYTDLTRIERFRVELADCVDVARKMGENAPALKGDWCTFATCKAACKLFIAPTMLLAEKLAAAKAIDATQKPGKIDAKDFGDSLPELLDLAEIAETWAKELFAAAQRHAENGNPVDGWELVAKRSSGRDWVGTEEDVKKWFKNRRFSLDDYMPRKLITPPAAEKLLKANGREMPDDLAVKKPSSGATFTRAGSGRDKFVPDGDAALALVDKLRAAGLSDG